MKSIYCAHCQAKASGLVSGVIAWPGEFEKPLEFALLSAFPLPMLKLVGMKCSNWVSLMLRSGLSVGAGWVDPHEVFLKTLELFWMLSRIILKTK
jgi:hypothetical protein